MNKIFKTFLTAVASITLALGFAVSPANAAVTPGTIYIGGPSNSKTDCATVGNIGVFSDSAHATLVTSLSGTGGALAINNVCSDYGILYSYSQSTSGSIPGTAFDNGIRSSTTANLNGSGTLTIWRCPTNQTLGGVGGCSTSNATQVIQITSSIPPQSGGGSFSTLYPLNGLSVSGNLTVDSVLTATPGTWSLTSGGAAVTTDTLTYTWYVCDASDSNSTDAMNSRSIAACLLPLNPFRVLSSGSGIATSGTFYSAATLTLNQSLLTALNGKHLAVVVRVTAGSSIGRLVLPTCGAIGTATSCSVSFGAPSPAVTTPATPTPTPTPKASAVPAKGTAAALATIPKASKAPMVKFGSGKRSLGESTKNSLKKVATIAKDGYAVRVTGAAGMQAGVPREFVKALATKRAMDIRSYLIKQGVPKEDIIVKTEIFPIGKAPSTLVKIETLR